MKGSVFGEGGRGIKNVDKPTQLGGGLCPRLSKNQFEIFKNVKHKTGFEACNTS